MTDTPLTAEDKALIFADKQRAGVSALTADALVKQRRSHHPTGNFVGGKEYCNCQRPYPCLEVRLLATIDTLTEEKWRWRPAMTDPLIPEELREETHVLDTFPGALALCRWCHKPWPCPTARMLATVEALQAEVETLRAERAQNARDELHGIAE